MVRFLKRLWKRFEAAMAAVAFAEEGEVEEARRIMAEARKEDSGDRRHVKPTRPSIVSVPVPPISALLGNGPERQVGEGANAP